MDLEKNPFEDNQGDNYITKRQTFNQWRQVESLILFGLWTLKKIPLKDNQGDNYITKRQMYDQWRQVESLILLGLWT